MSVFFLTRANLWSASAHAGQILAMSKAYYDLLGDDYALHAPGRRIAPFHRPIAWFDNQWLRYLAACGRAAGLAISRPGSVFLTRDIALAFTILMLGGKAVYEVHSQPAGKVPAAMFRLLAGQSRFKLVCISQALADYYSTRFAIPNTRILVAHSGVFPEFYPALRARSKTELRESLELPADKLLVVHTGSLYKGGAELFGKIAQAGSMVFFVHLGGNDLESRHWSAYYRDRGLENIRFIPHTPAETVREYQVAADLLFYMSTRNSPIYWCTSPLKLFEYMASGTPILGANLGSVAEVFDDSVGFCFDPDRPETIIQSFEYFRQNPDEAERRAARALTAAEQQYSWHRRAQAILDFATQS